MSCQVWFSNRRARLRKTAQSCSSPGYNPLALNMSGYSPASYMQVPTDNLHSHNRNTPPTLQGSVGSLMESPDPAAYSSAMQGLSSYASNIMAAGVAGVGHTMNQYAATAAQQSSLLSSQVRVADYPIYPTFYVVHFTYLISTSLQISPVNNNISKSNFSGGSGTVTPPPALGAPAPGPGAAVSAQSGMGAGAGAGGMMSHASSSFSAPTSFPRQQFPSSGMYGWY